jgi:hypothetical protein
MATLTTASSRRLDSEARMSLHYVGSQTVFELVLIISRMCLDSNILSVKIMRVMETANFRLAALRKASKNKLLRESSLPFTA